MTFRPITPRSSVAVCAAVLIASLYVAPGPVRATAPDVGTEAQRESGKKLYLQVLRAVPWRERRRRGLRRLPSAAEAPQFHRGQVQDPDDTERSAADPPGPRQRHQARHAVYLDAGVA